MCDIFKIATTDLGVMHGSKPETCFYFSENSVILGDISSMLCLWGVGWGVWGCECVWVCGEIVCFRQPRPKAILYLHSGSKSELPLILI